MKAKGNGAPQTCANNLFRLFRGEVPYERVKGLDPRLIDRPIVTGDMQLRQDADWLIDTYEPRTALKSISVVRSDAAAGGFIITAELEERGES